MGTAAHIGQGIDKSCEGIIHEMDILPAHKLIMVHLTQHTIRGKCLVSYRLIRLVGFKKYVTKYST